MLGSPGNLHANQKMNIIREKRGNLSDNVSAKHMNQGVPLRGTKENALCSDGGGKIGDGVSWCIADGVAGDNRFTEALMP